MQDHSFSVGNFGKGILLSSHTPLLASTTSGSIQTQTQPDQSALQIQTQATDLTSCKTQHFSS